MQRGVRVLDPVVKTLACGDTGKGAMASAAAIVEAILHALGEAERDAVQAASWKNSNAIDTLGVVIQRMGGGISWFRQLCHAC